jgi:hypothetical protein
MTSETAAGAAVVGVLVAGVVVVWPVVDVDVVLVVVLVFDVPAPCRAAVGVEQPSAERVTAPNKANAQAPDHFLTPLDVFTLRPFISVFRP